MATQQTLEIIVADDTTLRVDVVTEDGGSTPQTMTGWTLSFVLEPSHNNATVVTKTTSSGITIGNGSGTDDRATIVIEDSDTTGWKAGNNYRWSLKRTNSGNQVTLAYGPAILREVA